MEKRVYGWKPALPDHRNFKYALMAMQNEAEATLPTKVDLRNQFGPVFDQGQLGSCTANAGSSLFEFTLKKQGLTDFVPSRLFIYYWERALQGTIKQDSGATITDCLKVLAKYGACAELNWPYVVSKFKSKPPKADEAAALKNLAITYQQIDNTDLNALKTCLAAGYPIEFGFTVYESFESPEVAKTGLAPMPKKSEQILGGHANDIVGYDDSKKIGSETGAFICRNSWAETWGLAGYYYIPYSYLTNKNLASDFWTLRKVA